MLIKNTFNKLKEEHKFLYTETCLNPGFNNYLTLLLEEVEKQIIIMNKSPEESDKDFVQKFLNFKTQQLLIKDLLELNAELTVDYITT